jgi:hypothetical protein
MIIPDRKPFVQQVSKRLNAIIVNEALQMHYHPLGVFHHAVVKLVFRLKKPRWRLLSRRQVNEWEIRGGRVVNKQTETSTMNIGYYSFSSCASRE